MTCMYLHNSLIFLILLPCGSRLDASSSVVLSRSQWCCEIVLYFWLLDKQPVLSWPVTTLINLVSSYLFIDIHLVLALLSHWMYFCMGISRSYFFCAVNVIEICNSRNDALQLNATYLFSSFRRIMKCEANSWSKKAEDSIVFCFKNFNIPGVEKWPAPGGSAYCRFYTDSKSSKWRLSEWRNNITSMFYV
jgi:hypothetical protein